MVPRNEGMKEPHTAMITSFTILIFSLMNVDWEDNYIRLLVADEAWAS